MELNPDAYRFHRLANVPANYFKGHLLISDQVTADDVALIWGELAKVLQASTPGAIVEFGCYAGTSSLFIRRLLDEQKQSTVREFHVYDSFEGLPAKRAADQSAAGTDFTAGKLAVSKKEFLGQFHAARLRAPVVHKGWFDTLTSSDIPSPIAFAFLDGDFYSSILASLKLVWPQMSPGGTVLIDDYQRAELPGVERAVHDFFAGRTQPTIDVRHSIAILKA